MDVVARRGSETIYAEVKGRTKSRPGAGLDTLYGQLLRRMPAEEVSDPTTRFAVVIPTGAEAAALRVPRRVRDLLRIDIYAVSDDGQVERLSDSEDPRGRGTLLGPPPRGPSPRPVARRPPSPTGSPGRTRRSSSTCCSKTPRSRNAVYTDEPRLPGEKRADFQRQTDGSMARKRTRVAASHKPMTAPAFHVAEAMFGVTLAVFTDCAELRRAARWRLFAHVCVRARTAQRSYRLSDLSRGHH